MGKRLGRLIHEGLGREDLTASGRRAQAHPVDAGFLYEGDMRGEVRLFGCLAQSDGTAALRLSSA